MTFEMFSLGESALAVHAFLREHGGCLQVKGLVAIAGWNRRGRWLLQDGQDESSGSDIHEARLEQKKVGRLRSLIAG